MRIGDWYDLTHELFVPDIIISSMTRGDVRFVSNLVGAVITNNLYGWRWRPDTPSSTRIAILTWLRGKAGQATVLAAARRQGAGLRKLEPGGLANVAIPYSIARPPQTLYSERANQTARGIPLNNADKGSRTRASVHRPLASFGK